MLNASKMIQKDPQAEVKIDKTLIQYLLKTQFPQLAHLKIEFLDAGWDNENYRLGSDYIIRLPRRQVATQLLLNEINWLPNLQKKLPIPIPAPAFCGKPNEYYPWQWTIIPWHTGKSANLNKPDETEAFALVRFLKALHQKNPTNAPENHSRGVPLSEKIAGINERMARLKKKTRFITPRIEQLLTTALNTPFPTEKYLLHGDLHPRNMIVHQGKIAAIIDWGDITDGDVATDLASLWMLFESPSIRQAALEAYGATPDLINRAIGWAIFFGVILLDTGLESNAQHAEIGKFTLENVGRI